MKKYRLLSGFTLIELLVTIAIATILIAVAAPSFTSLVSGVQTDSAIRRLANSFEYARREAVTLGADITVCATADRITCSNNPAHWTLAWLVVDSAGRILQVEDINQLRVIDLPGAMVTIAVDAGFSSVCFDNMGAYAGAAPACNGVVPPLSTFTATSFNLLQISMMTLSNTGAVRIVCTDAAGICD
jgi:prepilin-type N-terminal cleavage/methylation domain-containing protein